MRRLTQSDTPDADGEFSKPPMRRLTPSRIAHLTYFVSKPPMRRLTSIAALIFLIVVF